MSLVAVDHVADAHSRQPGNDEGDTQPLDQSQVLAKDQL